MRVATGRFAVCAKRWGTRFFDWCAPGSLHSPTRPWVRESTENYRWTRFANSNVTQVRAHLSQTGNLRAMDRSVRALRGATTLDNDEADHLLQRVGSLVTEMIERNSLEPEDIISILFTATPDIHSIFPAVAARNLGLGDVPLICAQEIDVAGAMPLCVRVMMHVETSLARAEVRHVYQHNARSLRDDLPE